RDEGLLRRRRVVERAAVAVRPDPLLLADRPVRAAAPPRVRARAAELDHPVTTLGAAARHAARLGALLQGRLAAVRRPRPLAREPDRPVRPPGQGARRARGPDRRRPELHVRDRDDPRRGAADARARRRLLLSGHQTGFSRLASTSSSAPPLVTSASS